MTPTDRPSARPCQVVVMGVSGCGKTTIGQLLAQALGVDYVEGDALHPPANVTLMAAGIPLTDADRHGWLAAVAERLAGAAAQARGVVVSCSALKHAYRDQLRAAAPGLRLVFLHGDAGLIGERLAARQGHYMPASLLQSQLDTLEPPSPDERAITLPITQPPEALVAEAARLLGADAAAMSAP